MHTYLLEMLQCPACHKALEWTISEQDGERIEAAEARCVGCSADYPVRDGIGLFLTPDLPRNDLWEQVESGVMGHLREHPELERQLMDGPAEALAPVDQYFRADVLEKRGDFAAAQELEELANKGLYTQAYMECWNSQYEFVLKWLSTTDGPIVDLASGKGYLVARLIRELQRPMVVTDFSPTILRRNRRYFESFGLYDAWVSLLAFDARRTPFKDGAVKILTTNVGLPNIEEPGDLLEELRRIVDGVFLAISHFFTEEDDANAEIIRKIGLDKILYRVAALALFEEAGWVVAVKNSCVGEARPTPVGVILEGARIDGLPVADTNLEWCVLLASNSR